MQSLRRGMAWRRCLSFGGILKKKCSTSVKCGMLNLACIHNKSSRSQKCSNLKFVSTDFVKFCNLCVFDGFNCVEECAFVI